MSPTDAPPPESGALSVDQAVELIAGPSNENDDDGENDLFSASEPPDDDDDAELGLEADPADPGAPHFWSAEDKAAFAALPVELQETVARYEKNRDDATARVIQEAAETRNQAVAETSALAQRLGGIVEQAEAALAQAWPAEPDWAELAREHGPEEAARAKLRFDEDAADMQRLYAAKQDADDRDYANFVVAEFEKLSEVEPELTDPERGAMRRQAVVKFLADNGVPVEQIRHAGATEFALAYDALRYRMASAAMAQPSRTAAARPSLSPAAAQPLRSPQQRRSESSKARFAQKPTIANAVAAILAKG